MGPLLARGRHSGPKWKPSREIVSRNYRGIQSCAKSSVMGRFQVPLSASRSMFTCEERVNLSWDSFNSAYTPDLVIEIGLANNRLKWDKCHSFVVLFLWSASHASGELQQVWYKSQFKRDRTHKKKPVTKPSILLIMSAKMKFDFSHT